jgi:LacI family transcriptional regulator
VIHRGWDHAVDHNWTAGYCGEQEYMPREDRLSVHLFPALHPVERWFNETNPLVHAELKPFAKWLDKCQPEVILAKDAYVVPLFEKLGLRIPQDVAFANLLLEEPDGSIAGVRQNHDVVGALAVEILAGQLQHKKFGIPKIATTTFVEGTWFDGASCPPRQALAASRVAAAIPAESAE